ncbi:hypothetical protein CTEN210_00248 [Chaetoceros tenuissimus]|uniref:Uncharacterized protein n=1 Tax=Chaetoceros tenuissimus TaxID=426638 RepID=A0AAD3GYN0_9STRA|nr:hypothetical protein CTEN210_00248 [Chaetoceros tenuissimus]
MSDVPLANGTMSFNRVCREIRCKFSGDKSDSKSLEELGKVLSKNLPAIKAVSEEMTVNRLICGSCNDFKIQMTVALEDFGAWEESGFAPESEILEAIDKIEGVDGVETQTITNMVL